MVYLLDVNVLIALVDSDHVHHNLTRSWFHGHHQTGWATCPLTENGMLRVLSQPAYPSGARSPAEVLLILTALQTAFKASHHFWPDNVSLTDRKLFNGSLLVGSRQVTDLYLLGLAAAHGGSLVSYDRSLPIELIYDAPKTLVHNPQVQL